MKRFLIFLATMLTASVLNGQEVGQILERLDNSRISLDYSCTVKGQTPFENSGSLTVQQNCYRLSTPGFGIYCDGRTRWTVDTQAREVMIDLSEGTREFLNDVDGYLSQVENLKIRNVKYSPLDADTGIFTFDCSGLGKDWIVTDLR